MSQKPKPELLLGDCVTRLREFPEGCIDMALTSPPYDNLRHYNGNCELWNEDVWREVLSELYRVTTEGGVVVWVVSDATINGSETGTSFRQALHAIDCGFRLHDTMVWVKPNGAFPDKSRYFQNFEYMFVFSKGKPKTFQPIKKRNKTGGLVLSPTMKRNKDGDCIISTVNEGKKRLEFGALTNSWYICNSDISEHPAVFPLTLAMNHILSWSNPNDLILDPFLGSGTTGVAAKKLKRKFIGIELDETYLNLAKNRIDSTLTDFGLIQ